MIDHRVYLVTDDPSRYSGDWIDAVVAAVDGGVTCVQYRDTESGNEARYERAKRLREVLRVRHVPLIVNNDAALAVAVGAEGVHVGQSDMPPCGVRRIVGGCCEIGLSITDASQLADERTAEADCFGVGPVYDARKTKADASNAIGLDGFMAIRGLALKPVVAIGGITLLNAAGIVEAGADGLAVVSAFSRSDNPYEVARRFLRLFTAAGDDAPAR